MSKVFLLTTLFLDASSSLIRNFLDISSSLHNNELPSRLPSMVESLDVSQRQGLRLQPLEGFPCCQIVAVSCHLTSTLSIELQALRMGCGV